MIRVKDLTRFYADLKAVDQVSFEIGHGEIVGLLGHNGAGKTTIMKMMTGYLEPTRGRIEIDGIEIGSQREAVQRRIGYLPENDPLYPEMTVIDYLDYAAELHGVPAGERIERIGDAIRQTALEVKAAEPIGTLSRGYRQRVGVAQAILHQPKVLILDEPTNGLDPTQVKHMRDLIRRLAKQATVIISTHILQEVEAICDRVLIIRNGHKALDSTLSELQTGKRLVVALDAAPQQATELLTTMKGIDSVDQLNDRGSGYRYALGLNGEWDVSEIAPEVAGRIVAEGMKLYALQPESRNLETIFGEISAQ